MTKGAHEIWHQAEFGLHGGEEFGGLAGGGYGIEGDDTGHDGMVVLVDDSARKSRRNVSG